MSLTHPEDVFNLPSTPKERQRSQGKRSLASVRLRAMLTGWAAACSLGLTGVASAADWPQWRGPVRNGISTETGWNSRWPSSGPRKVWTTNVGEGWSAVSVIGSRLYTAGNSNGRDTIYCLNADTGKPIWKYSYPCPAGDYGGPRATPTVIGGRVYMMSRTGGVVCLDAGTGKVVWGRDVAREIGAEVPGWGFGGSPLVEGNLVIFNIGSSGTALDKNTGKIVWKSGGQAGYSSPSVLVEGGRRLVLLFTEPGLTAVNPSNGRVVWRHGWDTQFGVNAADPVYAGTDVFISSNYGKGCALLRTAGGRPSVIWQNRSMRNHFNTSVLVGGAIYGNDENTLRCLDLRTGNERWAARGMGKGGLIASDGKLIYLTERGELVIAAATPDRYTELARAQVLQGSECWTHPVLANGRIYCRSHQGDIVCVDVRR